MYLARVSYKGGIRFIIRESFFPEGGSDYLSRDLFDLGSDPRRYIHYPGGNAFYLDESIEETLRAQGLSPPDDELEELLWRFVSPDIRAKLEPFRRSMRTKTGRSLTPEETEQIKTGIHLFDKRRQHYLRYGTISQERLFRSPPQLFRPLLNKSRDEIEQFFLAEERVLEPNEYRQYVYVIFNLQRFFEETAARVMPEGLDQSKVDEVFLDEICRLNNDTGFWAGFSESAWLHDYLQRYVIMFFDYGFGPSSYMDDYLRQFMNSRRTFRFPEKKSKDIMAEASTLFGVPEDELKAMNRRTLTKLFRRKAHEHHPDKGGEHDSFVQLTEYYHILLKSKS